MLGVTQWYRVSTVLFYILNTNKIDFINLYAVLISELVPQWN